MERIWWKYKATGIHKITFKARLALFLQCMKATDKINKRMNKRMNNAHGEKGRENGEGRERKPGIKLPGSQSHWELKQTVLRVWGWVKAHRWLRMHVSCSSLIKGQRTVWGLIIIAWNQGNIKFCDPAHPSRVHVCGWLDKGSSVVARQKEDVPVITVTDGELSHLWLAQSCSSPFPKVPSSRRTTCCLLSTCQVPSEPCAGDESIQVVKELSPDLWELRDQDTSRLMNHSGWCKIEHSVPWNSGERLFPNSLTLKWGWFLTSWGGAT